MEAPACHTAALQQSHPGKRLALAAYWTASRAFLPAWESSLYGCREAYKLALLSEPCSSFGSKPVQQDLLLATVRGN